ncbi:MAG: hypothetical protein ACKVTZ_16715 [Bacteroidia bacterium]
MKQRTNNICFIKYLFGVLFLLGNIQLQAQDTTKVSRDTIRISISRKFAAERHKKATVLEVGINASALIVQMIPFLNRETSKTGPFGFSLKLYSQDNAFRFGLGARLTANGTLFNSQFDQKEDYFNVRMGYEWRKKLSPKWNYTLGGDGLLIWGNLNAPIAGFGGTIPQVPNIFGGIVASPISVGIAGVAGIEYEIMPRLSISTESMLFIGAGQINMAVVPPVSIFIHAKL